VPHHRPLALDPRPRQPLVQFHHNLAMLAKFRQI
jgi:hypothetical protein